VRSAPLLALLLAACASAPPAAVTRADRAALDAWTQPEAAAIGSTAVSRAAPRRRYDTVRIERPRAGLPVRRGPRMDLRLERARLSNALRLLAEAANLGLVLGEGLDTEVSCDLRRVRPVEAMQALAEAHQIELRVIGRTIIALRRDGT